MKPGKSFTILSVLIAGCVASPMQVRAGDDIDKSKPVEIKLKFREGRVYFVESVSQVVQKINMGGRPMTQNIQTTICHRESVEGVKEDIATLGLQFDHMAMQLSGGMAPAMSYDSDQADGSGGSMLKQMFEPMLHKPMTMELSRNGEVKSFSGMDAIRDEVSKKAGSNMMWMQMQAAYSDEAARLEYGDSRFEFLPGKPVSIGDTWNIERRREMPGLGSAAMSKTEYKLTDVKAYDFEGSPRRVAVIEFSGTIEGLPPKGDEAGGASKPMIDSGSTHGTILFDLKRGLPIHMEREGNSKLKLMGSPMGNMDIDVTVSETNNVMSKKAREAQRKSQGEKADSEPKSE